VQVPLSGHNLGVTHALRDCLEILAAGERLGGVCVAKVVDADVGASAQDKALAAFEAVRNRSTS